MSQIEKMSRSRATDQDQATTDRRGFLSGAAAALATTAMAAGTAARAQTPAQYGPHAEPVRYPDPDIMVLDKRFAKIKIGNTPIRPAHGHALGRRAGLERCGQVSRLVRYPQRRPAPLARG